MRLAIELQDVEIPLLHHSTELLQLCWHQHAYSGLVDRILQTLELQAIVVIVAQLNVLLRLHAVSEKRKNLNTFKLFVFCLCVISTRRKNLNAFKLFAVDRTKVREN